MLYVMTELMKPSEKMNRYVALLVVKVMEGLHQNDESLWWKVVKRLRKRQKRNMQEDILKLCNYQMFYYIVMAM